MKNINLRIAMAAVCLASLMAAFTKIEAGPVRFDQVVQTMNARPGKADTVNFTRISVVNYYSGLVVGDGDDDKKKDAQPQDGRVITETRSDIIEDDVCDCVEEYHAAAFPKWALLGLLAIPIAIIIIANSDTDRDADTDAACTRADDDPSIRNRTGIDRPGSSPPLRQKGQG
jgi:hypothetical protein